MDRTSVSKRVSGKSHRALAKAPENIRNKWTEVLNLSKIKKGTRNSNCRQMILAWVSDPTWQDSYFSQSLQMDDSVSKREEGRWITR
eukprot:7318352-Karenia_brevis.AAC.1